MSSGIRLPVEVFCPICNWWYVAIALINDGLNMSDDPSSREDSESHGGTYSVNDGQWPTSLIHTVAELYYIVETLKPDRLPAISMSSAYMCSAYLSHKGLISKLRRQMFAISFQIFSKSDDGLHPVDTCSDGAIPSYLIFHFLWHDITALSPLYVIALIFTHYGGYCLVKP